MSIPIVQAAVKLVEAKTKAKGRAEWWRQHWDKTGRELACNSSWTAAEWMLYKELRDAGYLPEKCLPGEEPK